MGLKFSLGRAILLAAIVSAASVANAAVSDQITVTVTIQNLSVAATGDIAFGAVTTSSATVSTGSTSVQNDGNITETFSLDLTDPTVWTAVQAAPSAAEEYALLAQFNATQPGVGTFTYVDHALSTTSTASSASQFAGDQTGLSVPSGGTRILWFRFNAPVSTGETTEKTIVVTITGAAG